jgi:hypothetical protein
MLRAQQDAEYEASLAADRERVAREEELQTSAANETAARAADEAAAAAAAAELQRVALERAVALAARQAAKAAAMAPEPPAGPGVTQARRCHLVGCLREAHTAAISRAHPVCAAADASDRAAPAGWQPRAAALRV